MSAGWPPRLPFLRLSQRRSLWRQQHGSRAPSHGTGAASIEGRCADPRPELAISYRAEVGIVAGMEECGGSVRIRGEGRSGAGYIRAVCASGKSTGVASRLRAGRRSDTAMAAALNSYIHILDRTSTSLLLQDITRRVREYKICNGKQIGRVVIGIFTTGSTHHD